VLQELGPCEGSSAAGFGGEDALDAAIKSLVANARAVGANGVLSMDVGETESGEVVTRGVAVVLGEPGTY